MVHYRDTDSTWAEIDRNFKMSPLPGYDFSVTDGNFYITPDNSDYFIGHEDQVRFTIKRMVWKDFNVTQAVENWHSGVWANKGFVLHAVNENVNGYDMRIYSSDYYDINYHPHLEVTYRIDSDVKYFYVKDHLGSTRAVINEAGETVESYDYYPFGLKMPRRNYLVGEGLTKNLYTGKEKDDETGLYYFGARYYDPAIGRFLTVDPLSNIYPSWTPYNYSANNPIRITDPNGMNWWDDVKNIFSGNNSNEEMNEVRQSNSQQTNGLSDLAQTISDVGESVSSLVSEAANNVVDAVTDQDNLKNVSRVANVLESNKKLAPAAKTVQKLTAAASVVEKAVNTDFSDPQQTGDFIENTVQTTIETASGLIVGTALGIMMDDAKDPNGLSNLSNGRMAKSYSTMFDQRQAYIKKNFIDPKKK